MNHDTEAAPWVAPETLSDAERANVLKAMERRERRDAAQQQDAMREIFDLGDLAPPAPLGPRTSEIEEGLGIEPMDRLEAMLDVTKDAWSRGWALFGPGGILNDQRKALLSARSIAIRDAWDEAKLGKLTEARLDQEAHADAEYRTWLDDQALARAEWILLDQERDLIHARIARGNAILRATARGG